MITYSETDKKVNYKTNNQKRNEHKLHTILANIAIFRSTFSEYFIIKTSIAVTKISPKIT